MPLDTCRPIIENAIMILVNSRCAISNKGRTARKIWPRLGKRHAETLLKLQRSRLSTVIEIITGHCFIGIHARRIGLGHLTNDFCRSCEDEEENETILHLKCICLALGQRRKRHLALILLHGGYRTLMNVYWQSESLHRKFHEVPGLLVNVKQWALSVSSHDSIGGTATSTYLPTSMESARNGRETRVDF